MTRKPLENDRSYVLQADNKKTEYRIISLVGAGANSLVYSAEKNDSHANRHKVILKEFYPEGLGLKRNDAYGVYNDGNPLLFEKEKERFIALYKKICEIKMADDSNGSFSVCAVNSLLTGNGTLYFEIPYESSIGYSEITGETLSEILAAGRDICSITGALHNAGYLHLDIKPENLLCINRSYENANARIFKFLDFDSVQSKEAVQQMNVALSYSEGYCAPEQRSMRYSDITEQTDIFAIGVILFERIFGYIPDYETIELLTGSGEYRIDTEDRLFCGANSLFFVELKKFFRKTLCCNPQKRFESCVGEGDTVMKALEYLIELSENKPSVSMHKVFDTFCAECRLLDENGEPLNELLYPGVSYGYQDCCSSEEASLCRFFEKGVTGTLGVRAGLSDSQPLSESIDWLLRNSSEFSSRLKELIDGKRFILTGARDSGKTSALKQFYNDLRVSSSLQSAPIFISAGSLSEGETITRRILSAYFGFGNAGDMTSPTEALSEALNDVGSGKRCFPSYTLIVDGLDEVKASARERLIEEINWLGRHSNLFIVVSSISKENGLEDYAEISLNRIRAEQIKDYLQSENPDVFSGFDDFGDLAQLVGGNLCLVKMLADSEKPVIKSQTSIIGFDYGKCISGLEGKAFSLETKITDRIDFRRIFAAVCAEMIKTDSAVITKTEFSEIVKRDNSYIKSEIIASMMNCGVFRCENNLVKANATHFDFIVASKLKAELESICAEEVGVADNLLISSYGFGNRIMTYLSEITNECDNFSYSEAGRTASDSYVRLFDRIKRGYEIDFNSDPKVLLSYAFLKVSKEEKYKKAKAMAGVNILRSMLLARKTGFTGDEQELLRLRRFKADYSSVKEDRLASAYYSELKPLLGSKNAVSESLKAGVIMALVAAVFSVLFFHAIPHWFMSPPDIVVSQSGVYPTAISDWSDYRFTVIDQNETGTITHSPLLLEAAFAWSGFDGDIVVDDIIDSNTVVMKLKVNQIAYNECKIFLKEGALTAVGEYNAAESNRGKLLFSFNTEKNLDNPVVGVSVDGVKYNPDYNSVITVKTGDVISITAMAPEDDFVKYIKYQIGADDVVTVDGDKAEITVPENLSHFSLQVFARTESGKFQGWQYYNFYVLEPAPPTLDIRIDDAVISPFTSDNKAKAGSYIKITAYPSATTGDEIACVEYRINGGETVVVNESEVLVRVPKDRESMSMEVLVKDVKGLAANVPSSYSFVIIK